MAERPLLKSKLKFGVFTVPDQTVNDVKIGKTDRALTPKELDKGGLIITPLHVESNLTNTQTKNSAQPGSEGQSYPDCVSCNSCRSCVTGECCNK